MENNNNIEKIDLGIIYLGSNGKVGIELLLERDLFGELEMAALQNVCDTLQCLMNEIAKKLEDEKREDN